MVLYRQLSTDVYLRHECLRLIQPAIAFLNIKLFLIIIDGCETQRAVLQWITLAYRLEMMGLIPA